MESKVKSWLKTILKEENIEDFSVEVTGNSEKGDGYAGDIVFVSLKPINGKQNKNYDFILKCSKQSKALRESVPMKETFLNEIYIYDKVLPAFTQFQQAKGVTDVFNSVPKYYGSLVSEDMEIIVLDNLRKLEYTLWEKKKPLTREHLNLVLGQYAKFHAVSIAMGDQQPKTFENLSSGLCNMFEEFLEKVDMVSFLKKSVDEVHDVLQNDLDEHILKQWAKLKEEMSYIIHDIVSKMDGIKVILHGDCWNNNFMYKNKSKNELLPQKVAILDWQMSKCSSPILDLSYFIFATISSEDINDLNDILGLYYRALKISVERLGSNLELLYPLEKFFDDWQKYCKYGIAFSSLVFKICSTDKDEVIDFGDTADKGRNFMESFQYDVKDKVSFRNRSRHVVKYVVENGLI